MNKKEGVVVRLLGGVAGVALLCAGWMASPPALLFASTQAGPWYVSSAGNDTAGCGAQINPCKTISHLLPRIASDEQINVIDTITDNFTLTKNVTIAGAPGAAIDGNGARIITVNAGVNASLHGLTLRNGGGTDHGGLIHNAGTLTIINALLTQSTLTNADGGAIYNAGMLTITNSTISNNSAQYGGGIENQGELHLSDSAISNNVASIDGGGIDNYSEGVAHVSRVLINNNTSAGGAGINNVSDVFVAKMWITATAIISNSARSWGAGIYNKGQLSVANATVSSNHLPNGFGAAIDHQTGSLTMQYVTVAGNTVANASGSSAVNFAGTATLANSAIANAGMDNCSGGATSAGYNLSSDDSCSFFNQSTDLNDTDARLGALQSSSQTYATFTNPPLSGSPLVNRIATVLCNSANDQRGVGRPQDGACDIGAHEVVPIDLSLNAQAVPASLPAGATLTVTLNAANTSASIANNVVVTSVLPAGAALKDCPGAVACVAAGGSMTVALGTLNAGASVASHVRFIPQQSGNISLSLRIAGDEWESQLSNNTATISATVLKSADLAIRMSGMPTVTANAPFTMAVEVTNNGELAADAPVFTLTLPANVNFIDAQGAGWSCAQGNNIVSCTAQSSLMAKQTDLVTIMLQSGDAPATLHLIGSATSNTFDPDLSNNTGAMTLTVGNGSRVALPIVLR